MHKINGQLSPQWRSPIMVLQWIDTCASQWYLVLLYWFNTQQGIEPEIESSWEVGAIRSKSDRVYVSVAKSSLGVCVEWDRWLLLYPKTGISKVHAQSKASLRKFPSGHAPRVASVLCNLGFFQTLVLFLQCPCVASFCLFWRPFCHFFTSSWGLDFFLLRVVEHISAAW